MKDDTPATVLFVHYGNAWIRGSEQCLLDLVAHIDKKKFKPVIICNEQILADAALALGISATVSPAVFASSVVASRKQVAALRRLAVEKRARLIHANSTVVVPALVRVARSLCLPLVAHLHTIPNAEERRHQLLHQTSAVVGVSRIGIEGFVEEGMENDAVRLIYNGVDAERISRGDATGLRKALNIPEHAITLGAVCSLIHRKGVDVLLGALSVLRQRKHDVHLIVAGAGDVESLLRDQARKNNISDFAHFLGERRDAGAVLRDAVDIAVTAAREESFGLTVIESGYFGRPIVASDIPAHREAVVNGVTGVLAPVDDAVAFALQIERVIADSARRAEMGAAAMERVRRDFTMSRYVSEFESLYAQLMSAPARKYGWLRATRYPPVYSHWLRQVVAKRMRVT